MFLEASFLKVKYARTHTLKTLASSTAVKRWIWAVHPPYIFLMACLHTHRADAALALQLVVTSSHTTSHFLVSPRNCQKGLSLTWGGVWEFFFFFFLLLPTLSMLRHFRVKVKQKTGRKVKKWVVVWSSWSWGGFQCYQWHGSCGKFTWSDSCDTRRGRNLMTWNG